MSSDPGGAAVDGGAENTIEDLEAPETDEEEVSGGAGKGGSIVVMDP